MDRRLASAVAIFVAIAGLAILFGESIVGAAAFGGVVVGVWYLVFGRKRATGKFDVRRIFD